MRILTNQNLAYSINAIPEHVDDLRYCVLDYSNQNDVDFYFLPLIFLESFYSPCIDIRIGPYNIQMPLEWSVVIGDMHLGDLEIMPLVYLMDKDFDVFCFNPVKGYMPKFLRLEILNTWPDVKWFFPKLKNGHLLSVPLEDGENPLCAFFIKDTNKIPESLDIRKIM
jgi:hypothetical protein